MSCGVSSGRVYLVDAHSLIFQVFHAISAMSSPKGLPTNALFGFTRDLLFLRDKNPDYLIVVFDEAGPVFRNELYPEYKAHRPPLDNDLALQLPLMPELVKALGLPSVSKAGFEADDVIATIARAADARGLDVFICTSDKDCRQLISDRVRLYSLRKHEEFGREELEKTWGIKPEQVVDFQALVGDSVDNVPGVEGVGEKTAAKLLQEHGTIENLLSQVDKISRPKLRESLRTAAEKIALSRKLVRLDDAVAIDMKWDEWRMRQWNAPRLLEMFTEWNFRRLADQVRTASGGRQPPVNGQAQPAANLQQPGDYAASSSATQPKRPRQGNLFQNESGNGAPSTEDPHTPHAAEAAVYHVVDTPEKLDSFLAEIKQPSRFAFDLETTGLDPLRVDIVGLAFSWRPGEAWYIPIRAPKPDKCLDQGLVLGALGPVFGDANIGKVNQNIKYDMLVLEGQGVAVRGVSGDSMVADYLLNPGGLSHNLDDLAMRYLAHKTIPITDLIGKRGKDQKCMDQVPVSQIAEYAGEDAQVAWRLTELLEGRLKKEGLDKLYRQVEVPLIGVLAEMQFHGIRLDLQRLATQSQEMAKRIDQIEVQIHKLAGYKFNINSLPQLRKVLFEELKLPAKRRTGIKGEPSTDQETLEWLAANESLPNRELPKLLIEFREVCKLKSTYVDALPLMVNSRTGRVHTNFNQTVASTGRLSSSDPNLQNIPIRSEQGGQIRQAFVPAEGWVLIAADYSQIELRLMAHLSGDEVLSHAFAEDHDIHALVAAQIFGIDEKLVSSEMRRLAKTINFGVLYGMSARGLADRLKIPLEEAARFIDAYFARYPRVLEYQSRVLEKCRKVGHVSTLLGRRREISGVRSGSTYQQRNQPEREAINMEIQGSAADLMKLAMLGIDRRLKRDKFQARMLLTVHDELVFEAPPPELPKLITAIREEMTTPLQKTLELRVPLRVDIAAGPNWLDLEDLV